MICLEWLEVDGGGGNREVGNSSEIRDRSNPKTTGNILTPAESARATGI